MSASAQLHGLIGLRSRSLGHRTGLWRQFIWWSACWASIRSQLALQGPQLVVPAWVGGDREIPGACSRPVRDPVSKNRVGSCWRTAPKVAVWPWHTHAHITNGLIGTVVSGCNTEVGFKISDSEGTLFNCICCESMLNGSIAGASPTL